MGRYWIAAVAIVSIALGDAGYLGSVVQGPVVLGADGTEVEMLCEDVLIEVDGNEYSITGDFLFYSPVSEEAFIYFPVDIVTPFVSALYSATEPEGHLDRVRVTVDGREVEVFPLFVARWDSTYRWSELAPLLEPVFTQEPVPGGPVYCRLMPSYAEVCDSCADWESMLPALDCQALNAGWNVDFAGGDTVLVEYSVFGEMTRDYESLMSILCYPLQTGSTWSGSIGRGRVTVVPSSLGSFDQITFTAGVNMPPVHTEEPFVYEPLPCIGSRPSFESSELFGRTGRRFEGGYVWEFQDFQPNVSGTGWRSLYPGLGDMYAMVADSLMMWQNGEIPHRPSAWSGSYIYIYLSAVKPARLTVISAEGLPLRLEPSEDAAVVAELPVTTGMDVLEWSGDWIRVEARLWSYLSGDMEGEYTGWVKINMLNDEGIMEPAVLPML